MDTVSQINSLKHRDSTIDMIKGFAMIAVVLLHINFAFPRNGVLNTNSLFGGLWHVAVFFVVSGWFLKDSKLLSFKSFAKGKITGLYLKAMYVYIPFVLLHNIFFKIGWLYGDVYYHHGILGDFTFFQMLSHIGFQFLFTQREPFSGAMWFVDSLFLGLLLYSMITICVSKLFRNYNDIVKNTIRFAICFSLAFMSAALRDVFEINIPKFSNTLSAVVLMCVGQMLGRVKMKFDNNLLLLMTVLVFFQYTVLTPSVALNTNQYKDVVFLIVSSVSALYVFGYISKKISNTITGETV